MFIPVLPAGSKLERWQGRGTQTHYLKKREKKKKERKKKRISSANYECDSSSRKNNIK